MRVMKIISLTIGMGLSNNKMLFSPFFVLREYIFSFQ